MWRITRCTHMATVGVKGSTLLTTCYLPSLAPASSRWAWYSECSAAYISSARRPACWPESAPNSSHQQPALSDISKSVPKPLVWSFRHYKSPTAPLDMHHLTFGINSLLHSVNLIVFTLLGSPHPTYITSSQSSPSFSPSVTPSTFHSRLKTHLFHKSFPP